MGRWSELVGCKETGCDVTELVVPADRFEMREPLAEGWAFAESRASDATFEARALSTAQRTTATALWLAVFDSDEAVLVACGADEAASVIRLGHVGLYTGDSAAAEWDEKRSAATRAFAAWSSRAPKQTTEERLLRAVTRRNTFVETTVERVLKLIGFSSPFDGMVRLGPYYFDGTKWRPGPTLNLEGCTEASFGATGLGTMIITWDSTRYMMGRCGENEWGIWDVRSGGSPIYTAPYPGGSEEMIERMDDLVKAEYNERHRTNS